MKRFWNILAVMSLLISAASTRQATAQVQGKDFGFGIILGDPLGATVKYWLNHENALVADIGASYFGSPRIQVDYLWHFNAFRSQVVKLYAGPGLAVGLGAGGKGWYYAYRTEDGKKFYYRSDGSPGIGARVVFGLNVIPRNTPIEIFLEAGPLIGISPTYGAAFDVGLGIRFYP